MNHEGRITIRCISLTQPWLWAILHANKRVENRTWFFGYRGIILLHAAKGIVRREFEEARGYIERVRPDLTVPLMCDLPRGGFCARADVVGAALKPTTTPTVPWHMAGQYGYQLANVEELDFVPWRGAQRIFIINEGDAYPNGLQIGGGR